MPTPGEIIKALRESKGMSRNALAKKIGVSRVAVGKWENDISEPTLSNAVEITKFFGISITEFGDAAHERERLDAALRELLTETLNAQSAAVASVAKRPRKLAG